MSDKKKKGAVYQRWLVPIIPQSIVRKGTSISVFRQVVLESLFLSKEKKRVGGKEEERDDVHRRAPSCLLINARREEKRLKRAMGGCRRKKR